MLLNKVISKMLSRYTYVSAVDYLLVEKAWSNQIKRSNVIQTVERNLYSSAPSERDNTTASTPPMWHLSRSKYTNKLKLVYASRTGHFGYHICIYLPIRLLSWSIMHWHPHKTWCTSQYCIRCQRLREIMQHRWMISLWFVRIWYIK